MSVTRQTTLGVVVIVFLAIFIFSALSIIHVENTLSGSAKDKQGKFAYMLDLHAEQIEKSLRSKFDVMMSDYYIREVIASKDREKIRRYFYDKQRALTAEYNTDILIHIYDENGESFSGMNAPVNPNQFAYSRDMIKDVAKKHVPRYGFDLDCYGLYYRYAEPIYFLGVFVGIAEIGVGLDYLLSSMSKTLDIEMATFIPASEKDKLCIPPALNISGSELLMNVSNPALIDILKRADFDMSRVKSIVEGDKHYRVYLGHSIDNYKGQKLASIATFLDVSKEKASVYNYVKLAVLMSVIFIAVTVFLMKKSFVRIIRDLEENYQESRSREYYLGNIIASSLNEIYVYDIATFRYIEVNRGACENLGYTQDEILKMTTYDIKPLMSRDELRGCVQPVIDGKEQTVVFETMHRRKNGSMYPVEIHVQKTFMKDRAMLIAIAMDTSLRKEVENELIKLNEALEKKVEHETERRMFSEKIMIEQKKFIDMGQMINAVAHQWRQPLNALGLYIQDMRDTYSSDGLNGEYVIQTEKDCMFIINHMSETIDDFRRFFAPGKKSEPFEVITAVIETIRLVSAQLKASSIDYRITCRCEESEFSTEHSVDNPECFNKKTRVFGYEGEFKQVLLNLIHNSKDVIAERREKEGFMSGMIEFDIDASGTNVILVVKDNGGGIPESVIGNVFDPYFTTKEEGKGTGIGLYMSRNIVEQHMKGTITVSNEKDKAVFTLVLKPAGSGSSN